MDYFICKPKYKYMTENKKRKTRRSKYSKITSTDENEAENVANVSMCFYFYKYIESFFY